MAGTVALGRAVATDGLDGILARRYGTTRSGAFLDPLADKVLVLGAMFALVGRGVFPLMPVVIIAGAGAGGQRLPHGAAGRGVACRPTGWPR